MSPLFNKKNKENDTGNGQKNEGSEKGGEGKQKEKGEKKNYDQRIEEENNFYVMPTKESAARIEGEGKSHKMMGVVVMACGVIVLAGAVYFSYAYFIAPSSTTEPTAEEPRQEEEPTDRVAREDDSGEETSGEESGAGEVNGEEGEQEEKEREQDEESEKEEREDADGEDEEEDKNGEDEEEDKNGEDEEEDKNGEDEEEEDGKKEDEDDEEEGEEVETVEDDCLSVAEHDLFGTDPSVPDTDGDGYEDCDEVLNLYDPAQEGAPIEENSGIAEYTDENYDYSLFYPEEWSSQEVGGEESTMFRAENNEFFQVIVQENGQKLGIEEWFETQFPDQEIAEDHVVETETWEGVKKKDQSIYYMTDHEQENIYVLSYSAPGSVDTPNYGATFKMAVKSFQVGDQ